MLLNTHVTDGDLPDVNMASGMRGVDDDMKVLTSFIQRARSMCT